jgi:hypothetical protein
MSDIDLLTIVKYSATKLEGGHREIRGDLRLMAGISQENV